MARTGVVRAARHVRQDAEVIVEGVVLLHQDDDVLHLVQVSVGASGEVAAEAREKDEQRDLADGSRAHDAFPWPCPAKRELEGGVVVRGRGFRPGGASLSSPTRVSVISPAVVKIVLFGGTGMVGQGVLRECLLDPDVTRVLSVARTSTGQRHEKLRELSTRTSPTSPRRGAS